MSDFVFCTGQYESGDWDSAPTLPANLIDSIARYTSIEVAPSGAIVPLSSDAIFEHPFVYLTGHLPFRFSERERRNVRSEEHTSELQSRLHLVCRLLLEKKKKNNSTHQ